jgi:hypothetical protein
VCSKYCDEGFLQITYLQQVHFLIAPPIKTNRLVGVDEKTNDRVAIDLFVHHKSKDSHHSSTAVVQFNGALAKFLYGKTPTKRIRMRRNGP